MSQINYVGLDLSYVLLLIYLYKNWEMNNNPTRLSSKQASGIGEEEIKDSRSRNYPEPPTKYYYPFLLY